ncbi:MAG: FAD:protein FMN transferase [Sedimentisphaerales bacterium]|nr:FAD:protein FMN transferase [Sedimentisphaerales bacterium]
MNKSFVKIRSFTILFFILFLLFVLFFSVINRKPVEFESSYRLVMGTFARVIIIAGNSKTAQQAATDAFAEMEKVDDLMSDYKDNSDIGIVNKEAFQRAVQVSESTFEVIRRSVVFSKLTDGAFDITVGPLVDLFRKSRETQIAPTKEEIEKTKTKVGYEKLILDETNRTVKFTVEGMRLDLGGIAKGYGVDKAIEAIQKTGVIGAMVDIGGNIRCFGIPAKGKKTWLVGIQNPNLVAEKDNDELVMKLKITNESISTSGNYQQFVIIDGKRYSHIIDRRTGTGAEGLSSVTIISNNAADADALSTAVSVIGVEKGLALIETIDDTEAILIPSGQNQFIMTRGADKYIKE